MGELQVADLAIGLAGGTVLLLDVRSPEDVAHGHIPGSWPVAIGTLPARIRDPDDPLHARLRHRPPAVTTIAVVAGGPTRLDTAFALLAEVGITAVGVVGEVAAWSRAGRPLNRGHVL